MSRRIDDAWLHKCPWLRSIVASVLRLFGAAAVTGRRQSEGAEMEQREQVLCAIPDAGEPAGPQAEVARVEDMIRRMAIGIWLWQGGCADHHASSRHGVGRGRRGSDADPPHPAAGNSICGLYRGGERAFACGCGAPLPLEELRARVEAIRTMRDDMPWRIPLAYLLFPARSPCFSAVRCGMVWRRSWCSMVLYAIGRMGARIALQPLVPISESAAAMCLPR